MLQPPGGKRSRKPRWGNHVKQQFLGSAAFMALTFCKISTFLKREEKERDLLLWFNFHQGKVRA